MTIHTSISALSGPIVNHPERGGCLPAANPPAFARRAGGGQSRGVWAEGPLHGGAVVEEEASARAGTTKPLKTPHRQLPSAIGVAFDNAPDRKLPGRGKFLALGDNPFHERRFTSAWEDIAHQRGPGPQHWSPSWVSPEVFDCARRLHQLGPAMEMARSRFAGSCILLGGAQTQESAMPPSASERACNWLGLFLLHVDGAEQVRGICATESIMRNRVDLGGHFRFQGLLANLT